MSQVTTIDCEKCGKKAISMNPSCHCDKDNCLGQRCGANDIISHYKCLDCGWQSESTAEGRKYIERHSG